MLYLTHQVRFTSNRFIRPLSQAYQELATAYSTNNCAGVQTVINKYQDLYSRDHNLGLVKQVLIFLYKKNIQRLTKTFLTLSLSDVASRVQLAGPADAEKYILNMVSISTTVYYYLLLFYFFSMAWHTVIYYILWQCCRSKTARYSRR